MRRLLHWKRPLELPTSGRNLREVKQVIGNIKMETKIGLGFGIIILIAAILGFVGWSGVNSVRSHMTGYALWSNIDMVMNENVIQKTLELNNTLI